LAFLIKRNSSFCWTAGIADSLVGIRFSADAFSGGPISNQFHVAPSPAATHPLIGWHLSFGRLMVQLP